MSSAAGAEPGENALVLYSNLIAPAAHMISCTPKKRRTSVTLEGQQSQPHGVLQLIGGSRPRGRRRTEGADEAPSRAMNILSWNCRGAGNFQIVRDLVSLVQAHSPSIVFLCETRQSKNKMSRYRARLGLRGFDASDSVGLSGGLALYWHESLSLDVKEINERYIDAYVTGTAGEPPWRLTCVYGEPRTEDRHRMWSLLRDLHQKANMPWVVVGDFNEAMWSFEHFSDTPRSAGQMLDFRDVPKVCGLGDLGLAGLPYTILLMAIRRLPRHENRKSGHGRDMKAKPPSHDLMIV